MSGGMRVAVVGAGVYGCVAALDLAAAGHSVEVYERHRGILYGATRAQQGRLHRGYHYPRSLTTAKAAQRDARVFAARFPTVVDRTAWQVYAIADEGSLTSADDYLRFCDTLGGGYRVTPPQPLLQGVEVAVAVDEAFINIPKLRELLYRQLRAAGVTLQLATEVDPATVPGDLVVATTYGRGFPLPLRYELCEVVEVALGMHYARRSFVILDGPHGISVDPVPGRSTHLLYDVTNSVHTAGVGTLDIPEELVGLVDRGPVLTPHGRLETLMRTARRYLLRVGMPTYHGSRFTVRAVLPDVDATDERPTVLHRDPADGRVVHVLAGKVDGAVTAAKDLVAIAAEVAA
jgi:glycine/D-amino acid oxidase-like deaminating enzyme